MTTFTTPDRQDAQRTPSLLEKIRTTIMNTAYWCADENMPEAYNAVKVMCSEVLAQLQEVQRPSLTTEQIKDIQAMCHLKNVGYDTFIMRFARAIERAHGIGE